MSRPASAHAWRCCGLMSRPSATAGPSCEQMPCAPAVYIIGICCGRLAHTSSAPAGPWCWRMAVRKKCPNFRHSMLRSVVSHTIGSNCAMVHADALTSRRTCLALLQAAVSHTIGSNWAGNWLGHHRHQQGLGACGWLYEKSVPISDTRCYGHPPRTPSAVTLTWSARIPRTASAHALRCYRRLARTPSAATATWCEQMPRPASTWCAEQPRGMPG